MFASFFTKSQNRYHIFRASLGGRRNNGDSIETLKKPDKNDSFTSSSKEYMASILKMKKISDIFGKEMRKGTPNYLDLDTDSHFRAATYDNNVYDTAFSTSNIFKEDQEPPPSITELSSNGLESWEGYVADMMHLDELTHSTFNITSLSSSDQHMILPRDSLISERDRYEKNEAKQSEKRKNRKKKKKLIITTTTVKNVNEEEPSLQDSMSESIKSPGPGIRSPSPGIRSHSPGMQSPNLVYKISYDAHPTIEEIIMTSENIIADDKPETEKLDVSANLNVLQKVVIPENEKVESYSDILVNLDKSMISQSENSLTSLIKSLKKKESISSYTKPIKSTSEIVTPYHSKTSMSSVQKFSMPGSDIFLVTSNTKKP
ncbi:unnamed protein product [Gordionus sp. m RMFG-2023]